MDSKQLLNDTFDLSVGVGSEDLFRIIVFEISDMSRTIEQIMKTIRRKIDDTTEETIGLIGYRCGCLRGVLRQAKYSRSETRDLINHYSDKLGNIETMIHNIGVYCIRKRHGL